MSIKHKQIVRINSADRVSGSDSDFIYKIDKNVLTSNLTHVAALRVQIPKSYYNIETGKNTFVLIEGEARYTISLTPARYNAKSFRTELQTQLNSVGATNTYAVTFPSSATQPQTGKYTFSISSGALSASFEFSSNRCYEMMGFNRNSTSDTFSAESNLVSPNVVNLAGEQTLFIHSNICTNNDKDNVLADVYAMTTDGFSNVVFENKAPEMDGRKISKEITDSYFFKLTDEFGETINLNGQNIVMTLVLYEENQYIKLLKMISSIMLDQQIPASVRQIMNENDNSFVSSKKRKP